jgi:hypothetical protein
MHKSSGIKISISTSNLILVATGAHFTNMEGPLFRKSQVWKRFMVRISENSCRTDDNLTLPLQWSTGTRRSGPTPQPSAQDGIQTCRTNYSLPVRRRSRCSQAQSLAETRSGALAMPSTRPLAPVSRLTSRACLLCTVL